MPKGVPVWTPALDREVTRLFNAGCTALQIADHLGRDLSPGAVRVRLSTLGLLLNQKEVIAAFWTPEVDAKLRELWAQKEPQLTVVEIVALLPEGATEYWVRRRVVALNLGRRTSLGPKPPPGKRKRAGEHVKPAAIPVPAPKVFITYPRVVGCTYIDPHGDGSRCGKGDRQTCDEHRHRVAAIPKGSLGFAHMPFAASGGRSSRRVSA